MSLFLVLFTLCGKGQSAIFSMKVFNKRLLTIEVSTSLNKVVQVRGFANREMMAHEAFIVNKWKTLNGLR
jgi:hypothetical protein